MLQGSGPPVVLCSVDWCGIGNDAHDRWREVLADAAGTTRERVLVCAIHQHDAPLVDPEGLIDPWLKTLSYGDYGPVYIPTDRAFAEGGYEPGAWSFVAPSVEKSIKDVLALALAPQEKTATSQPLMVAKDGATKFVIVTATEPSLEEETAAQWLSETLEQVTGAKFPIRAAGIDEAGVAKPNEIRVQFDAKMKPEEWRIQTVDESLLLTGGQPRGAIYAVCEFLETHVGVARLDPFTEYLPKQPTLTIPALNRSGQPAFPFRFVFTGWPYQNWAPMGENGVNGARWRIWNKEHIQAGPINGDYPRTVPDGVHTFGHFISAKEFATEHPEYFSMDAAGERMTDDKGNKQLWIQLCVTNPDVRRITLERAKQMLRDDEVEAKKTVPSTSADGRVVPERQHVELVPVPELQGNQRPRRFRERRAARLRQSRRARAERRVPGRDRADGSIQLHARAAEDDPTRAERDDSVLRQLWPVRHDATADRSSQCRATRAAGWLGKVGAATRHLGLLAYVRPASAGAVGTVVKRPRDLPRPPALSRTKRKVHHARMRRFHGSRFERRRGIERSAELYAASCMAGDEAAG